VGIFRRGTKDTSADSDSSSTATKGDDGRGVDDPGSASTTPASAVTTPTSRPARVGGPFDRSEVGSLDDRLDLGALWLTGVPGMELRLEVEEESQNVVGVTAVLGESTVQLQAFAAPRSEGIWDDIRTEIAASITSQGGTADKTSGPLGAELRAQVPGQDPDGRTVFAPVRFVGVDGPRWFLRAVLGGPAAVDEGAASTLLDVVRATVVVRGDEAMAPRELLTLKLPEQGDAELIADEDGADRDPADERRAAEDAGSGPSLDDFKPFERGPEISEIR
jgi:Protein of unknown function (DUF3710)